MTLHPSARPLLAATVLLALLASAIPALGASPEPPKGTPEQRQTITTLRDVGTAMWTWYAAETKNRGIERLKHEAQADPTAVDVTRVPLISAQELAAILVPKYIDRVPDTDGWGPSRGVPAQHQGPPGDADHGHPQPRLRWPLLGGDLHDRRLRSQRLDAGHGLDRRLLRALAAGQVADPGAPALSGVGPRLEPDLGLLPRAGAPATPLQNDPKKLFEQWPSLTLLLSARAIAFAVYDSARR
jgi:hypothetical protein